MPNGRCLPRGRLVVDITLVRKKNISFHESNAGSTDWVISTIVGLISTHDTMYFTTPVQIKSGSCGKPLSSAIRKFNVLS
jgi:hypothetical protein